MIKPKIMTDVEFLQSAELAWQSRLYLYRPSSGLFRSAVRAKIVGQAIRQERVLRDIATSIVDERVEFAGNDEAGETARSRLVPSLYATVSEISLFDEATLHIRDLGARTLEHPPLDDIVKAVSTIASGGEQHSIVLLVPDTHKLIETDAWRAAVESIGLIEEPMVTPETYLAIARRYLRESRLGDLSILADNKRFQARLRKILERGELTPFELSMQIDLIVLGEMEGGEFRPTEDVGVRRAERWVLPETLRRFLDRRDAPSLSALMKVIDALRHDRMLDADEILTRLYRATTGALEGRDRRYRRLDDPMHCVWAAQILSVERSFITGSVFIALDDICQQYSRISNAQEWISSYDGWRTLALVLNGPDPQISSRLGGARFELQTALRQRLGAMNADVASNSRCQRPTVNGDYIVSAQSEQTSLAAGDLR